ncbi:hypothetical protein B0T25DRAFT_529531 [Lasiosphaeria hispida]|uniref:Secreted protein n=1 Tax=Lasiosphaeria hispida TaxID=260671 RepID=A0AAJ0HWY9_9PEZI|nr:hypothetical protein B0T25DRAFT_529531 [Lasiosphaeria hispida]
MSTWKPYIWFIVACRILSLMPNTTGSSPLARSFPSFLITEQTGAAAELGECALPRIRLDSKSHQELPERQGSRLLSEHQEAVRDGY